MWRGVIDGGGGLSKHATCMYAQKKKGGEKTLEKSELQGSVFFEKYVLLHMPEHTLKHAPGLKKT